DAMRMPPELKGFRTLFASFHHFPPEKARAILADAVRNRQGIAVLEFTRRSPLALLMMPLAVVLILAITPFVRPFRWSRLLFTYLIPIIPLVGLLDGMVSCLRTYSPRELRELVDGLPDHGYTWEIGHESALPMSPIPVTYLIGYPGDGTGRGEACLEESGNGDTA
ncbi:MAG: class I SAM-dependent methyltransferase, partial [Planctomycetota bacterium]